MISLLDIESNDICAIMGDNSIQNCIVICACLLLNIPYTSISPVFTHFYLGQQLNQTEAKYLFISRKHYPKIERLFKQDDNCQLKKRLKVIVFDNNDPLENPITDCSNFEKLIDAFQDVKIETIPYFSKSIDSTVTIVFTSGTTGKPKGACHTHRSIMNNLINLKRFEPLKLYHQLSTLLLLPVAHLSGNSLFFFLMATQTPIVLFDYSQIDSVFEIIEKYKIVQIYGTSNAMNTLVKNHEGHDISSIRLAMTGGTKLAESTANILFYDLGIKILDGNYYQINKKKINN